MMSHGIFCVKEITYFYKLADVVIGLIICIAKTYNANVMTIMLCGDTMMMDLMTGVDCQNWQKITP